MKTLHIVRSEPTQMTRDFIRATSTQGDDTPVLLYQDDIDYDRLVDGIFSSDRVICWW